MAARRNSSDVVHPAINAAVSGRRAASSPEKADGSESEFLRAVSGSLRQLGIGVVPVGRAGPCDVPIEWRGMIVAYARPPSIGNLFESAVRRVEARIGCSLGDVAAVDRRTVVRLLDEEGVFEVREAVPRLARRLGVCNTTVYGVLKRARV